MTGPQQVIELLQQVDVTRAQILGKFNELYNPIGLYELLKLLLKLKLQSLTSFPWHDSLPPDVVEEWNQVLSCFPRLPDIVHRRSVVPHMVPPHIPAQLICICDAAQSAIGAAIYLGFPLPDGTYSCSLLAAKS